MLALGMLIEGVVGTGLVLVGLTLYEIAAAGVLVASKIVCIAIWISLKFPALGTSRYAPPSPVVDRNKPVGESESTKLFILALSMSRDRPAKNMICSKDILVTI